jgi:hypothetical protein
MAPFAAKVVLLLVFICFGYAVKTINQSTISSAEFEPQFQRQLADQTAWNDEVGKRIALQEEELRQAEACAPTITGNMKTGASSAVEENLVDFVTLVGALRWCITKDCS